MKIKDTILSILSTALFHILPPRCVVTGDIVSTLGSLSPQGWQKLSFIDSPLCHHCGLPLAIQNEDNSPLICAVCILAPPSFNQARSAVVYDDVSRALVLGFKHGDQTHLAKTFVPWLKTAGADFLKDCDVILPVPLHRLRLLKRRYNQSALIAHELARQTGLRYEPSFLRRIRHTPVQGHLSAQKRHENVRNAFTVDSKKEIFIKDKKIILIDDVLTTGATVEECAKILYEAGAERVDVLTVARVVKSESMS